MSHLRFGKEPIRSTYLISEADFISCSMQSYVYQFALLDGLKKGGTFLLNTSWTMEELDEKLPASMKKYLAEKNINFYIIDATALAQRIGLGGRINMIMQTAFFKLANVIEFEEAVKYLKEAVIESYGRKGDKIVDMNMAAIEQSVTSLQKVAIKKNGQAPRRHRRRKPKKEPAFIENILRPIAAKKGDDLPVSVFEEIADGTFPLGTSAYEKRGIAAYVPEWQAENCIQCGRCSFVCPHAAVRPFLISAEEAKTAPKDFGMVKAIGKDLAEYQYRIQVSPLDCTGCGSCAQVCPAKSKALVMKPFEEQLDQAANFEYALTLTDKSKGMDRANLKNSQFVQPLLEFSGACGGCGETPYAKYITQYCGERMIVANATGCSFYLGRQCAEYALYGVNAEGKGPAWSNSLFEDNAEYGYGMAVAVKQIRELIKVNMEEIVAKTKEDAVKKAAQNWIDNMDDVQKSERIRPSVPCP